MIPLPVDASRVVSASIDLVRTCRVGGYWEGSSAVASSSDSLSSGGTLRSYRDSSVSRGGRSAYPFGGRSDPGRSHPRSTGSMRHVALWRHEQYNRGSAKATTDWSWKRCSRDCGTEYGLVDLGGSWFCAACLGDGVSGWFLPFLLRLRSPSGWSVDRSRLGRATLAPGSAVHCPLVVLGLVLPSSAHKEDAGRYARCASR